MVRRTTALFDADGAFTVELQQLVLLRQEFTIEAYRPRELLVEP